MLALKKTEEMNIWCYFLQVKANKWNMHEEIWDKIRNLIWSVTNNSDNYAEKFNLAGNLPLWKIDKIL